MGSLLAGLIPTALAFAVSPISLIELILVVFSRRARVNGVVFLLTVTIPVFVVPVLGATLVKGVSDGSGGGGGSAWVKLVFGVVLLLLAVVNLRKYRDTDAPKVFDLVERMGPGAVFGLALGVTLANPKNLAVLLSAGELMREATVTTAQMLVGAAVFTAVAMAPYAVVIGYQRWGGEAAAARLSNFKTWLLRNNHKIMFWICLAIGLVMTGRGLATLFG